MLQIINWIRRWLLKTEMEADREPGCFGARLSKNGPTNVLGNIKYFSSTAYRGLVSVGVLLFKCRLDFVEL